MVEESDKHAYYANEHSDDFRNCDRSLGSRTRTSELYSELNHQSMVEVVTPLIKADRTCT